MNTRHKTLLEGDVAPHIRRLAVPLAWGMLAMMSFTVTDTYFISRLGTKHLAALGFTIPMVMFCMGAIFGLSVGTTSALSRVYGEGDLEKVRRIATDALVMTALIVTGVSLLGFATIVPVFRLMGAGPELMPLIVKYMSVWYCGLPFLGVMMIGNSCIRATGNTRFPSSMMILLAACSIVFDPFFIFGWGFFPRLEMTGAAVTLVLSYYLTCMVSLYVLRYRMDIIRFPLWHPGVFQSWRRIMHVAIPSVISNQIAPISAGIITWMAAGYGREAVAALGVANRIENVATLVFYSLGAGISIFSGQNAGAGNFGRIREAVGVGVRYSLGWGVFIASIFWFFATDIPRAFDDNAKVVAYTAQYLHWVPATYLALGVMIICNAVLNGIGRPVPATVIILLRAFVIYIPLAYIAKAHYGFLGILLALAATNIIVGGIAYAWNKRLTV